MNDRYDRALHRHLTPEAHRWNGEHQNGDADGAASAPRGRPVVVGYDGTSDGRSALRWASNEARKLDGRLRVVRAWQWDDELATGLRGMSPEGMGERATQSTLDLLAQLDPGGDPAIVEVAVSGDEPGNAILSSSGDAQVTVVGRHHLSMLDRAFVGSVSDFVLQHASNTVVIVPTGMPEAPPASARAVVVGIDGSWESYEALLFAVGEAARRSATLRIIAARPIALTAVSPGVVVPADLDAGIERQLLDDAADAVRRMPGGDVVDIKTDVFLAPAGVALVEACDSGDLLVVGTHGRGWLGRLALGSVSRHCVHNANVPTAVVPCLNRREGTWMGRQAGRRTPQAS